MTLVVNGYEGASGLGNLESWAMNKAAKLRSLGFNDIDERISPEDLKEYAVAYIQRQQEKEKNNKQQQRATTLKSISQTRWVNSTLRAVEHLRDNIGPLVTFLVAELKSKTAINESEGSLSDKLNTADFPIRVVDQAAEYCRIFEPFVNGMLARYSDPSTEPRAHLVATHMADVLRRYTRELESVVQEIASLELACENRRNCLSNSNSNSYEPRYMPPSQEDFLSSSPSSFVAFVAPSPYAQLNDDAMEVLKQQLTQRRIAYAAVIDAINSYRGDSSLRNTPLWRLACALDPRYACAVDDSRSCRR